MTQTLKKPIVKQIVSDWEMFAATGRLTGLKPMSLYTALKNNSRTITQYHVLEGLSKLFNQPISELVETVN